MKTKVSILLIVFSFISLPGVQAQEQIYAIEDFEKEKVGDLPNRWYNQKGDAQPYTYTGQLRGTYHYQVLEESGNRFLRFDGIRGKHLSFPLVDKEGVNIYETPVLSWKWRIFDTPDGANEDDHNKNDAAASIYVVFDLGRVLFKKVPKSIRYTWSSTLPAGTELSKFYGNQKIVVVGTGEEGIGGWQTFERNIIDDYKRLFGDNPPEVPIAILILSDGVSTGNFVKADYDDILLKSADKN